MSLRDYLKTLHVNIQYKGILSTLATFKNLKTLHVNIQLIDLF